MADTKISALPTATTPLAGTEQLPIVQGGETRRVSASALGGSGGGMPHPGYSALIGSVDRVYAGSWAPLITNGAPPSYNSTLWHPIIIPTAISLKALMIHVSGAQSGGSCYIGLYSSVNGFPVTRLLTSTAISVASTGQKIFIPASPYALAAGAYWAATVFSGTGGTMHAYNGSVNGFSSWAMGAHSTDYLGLGIAGFQDQSGNTYAQGLPTTAPTGGSLGAYTTAIPAVYLKVA